MSSINPPESRVIGFSPREYECEAHEEQKSRGKKLKEDEVFTALDGQGEELNSYIQSLE